MTGVGRPLEVRDDVELEPPRTGEVMVRVGASGVCHSDLSVLDGTTMAPVPVVLGHEGAGVVEEVGEGVTTVRPGDHVVISWVPRCGGCFFCRRGQPYLCERATVVMASGGLLDGTTRMRSQGAPLFQLSAAGTFSEVTIVPETGLVKVDDDLDVEVAALIGCAVVTGVGAATTTADIRPGDTVAVVGCGGVGLNVVQGARLQGAGEIVAVDIHESKLRLAERFGATATVDASLGDPVPRVMELTGERGADVSFEVVGHQRTIDQVITMTRRGGQAVVVGLPPMDAMVTVPAFFGLVMGAKTIKGCWYGWCDAHRDVPALVERYRNGDLKLRELISRTITLDQVNEAFGAMRDGEVARSVIRYSG